MATVIDDDGTSVLVGQFYGAMYWGFVVSMTFVGISLVQGYLYFTGNHNDRCTMRAVVISLLVLDPASSLLMAQTIYCYFLVNFGVGEALGKIPISWTVENELTVLVTTIVQVFFASRVYLVNNTIDALPLGRTAPILVLLFALAAFVVGTLRVTFIGVWAVSSFSGNLYEISVIAEESSALLSNLLASVCLCFMLAPPRLGSMRRSESIRTLFMFIVNRAILLSFVQIGLIVAYVSAKNSLYWMPFHLLKSKLYTNTLLSMLNSRPGGYYRTHSMRPPWTLPVIELTAKDNEGVVDNSMSTSEGHTEKTRTNTRPESNLPSPTSAESV